MICCAVFGIVISGIVLLSLLPVGIEASYQKGAFSIAVKLGPFSFRLPQKISEKRNRRHKAPFPGEDNRELPHVPPLPVLKALIFRSWEALCRIVQQARVDTLRICFTAGGSDPYRAALAYGAAGAAMESLLAAAEGRIAHTELRSEIDFTAEKPTFTGSIAAALRLYQAAAISGRLVFGFWKDQHIYRKTRKGTKDSE